MQFSLYCHFKYLIVNHQKATFLAVNLQRQPPAITDAVLKGSIPFELK